jgi:hypothetical protein
LSPCPEAGAPELMTNFRGIKSPVALATCGMFLVPEPLGACLLLAAAVWWLWRKTGCPCRGMLSSLWEAARRGLRLPGAPAPGGVDGGNKPISNLAGSNSASDRTACAFAGCPRRIVDHRFPRAQCRGHARGICWFGARKQATTAF